MSIEQLADYSPVKYSLATTGGGSVDMYQSHDERGAICRAHRKLAHFTIFNSLDLFCRLCCFCGGDNVLHGEKAVGINGDRMNAVLDQKFRKFRIVARRLAANSNGRLCLRGFTQ